MQFSWLPRLLFRLASFLPVSSINGPNPLLLPASRPGPRCYENPLRMLEHGRRHRPAVAEAAELPATLAANGSAADVLGKCSMPRGKLPPGRRSVLASAGSADRVRVSDGP